MLTNNLVPLPFGLRQHSFFQKLAAEPFFARHQSLIDSKLVHVQLAPTEGCPPPFIGDEEAELRGWTVARFMPTDYRFRIRAY